MVWKRLYTLVAAVVFTIALAIFAVGTNYISDVWASLPGTNFTGDVNVDGNLTLTTPCTNGYALDGTTTCAYTGTYDGDLNQDGMGKNSTNWTQIGTQNLNVLEEAIFSETVNIGTGNLNSTDYRDVSTKNLEVGFKFSNDTVIEGNFIQSSPHYYPITQTGTVQYNGAAGFNGNGALEFNGTANYLKVSGMDFNTSSLTACVWFSPSNFTAIDGVQLQVLNLFGDNTNEEILEMVVNHNTGLIKINNDYDYSVTATTYNTEINEYVFVCGVINSGVMRLYINGISYGADTGTQTPNAHNLYFGSESFGGRYFKGEIDNTWVYSRALSNAEINAIYMKLSEVPTPYAFQQDKPKYFGSGCIYHNGTALVLEDTCSRQG